MHSENCCDIWLITEIKLDAALLLHNSNFIHSILFPYSEIRIIGSTLQFGRFGADGISG